MKESLKSMRSDVVALQKGTDNFEVSLWNEAKYSRARLDVPIPSRTKQPFLKRSSAS